MKTVQTKTRELRCRARFLRGLARDFAALRADPKKWREEQAERRAWDAALGDDRDEVPEAAGS